MGGVGEKEKEGRNDVIIIQFENMYIYIIFKDKNHCHPLTLKIKHKNIYGAHFALANYS